jgi:hypothetical protein
MYLQPCKPRRPFTLLCRPPRSAGSRHASPSRRRVPQRSGCHFAAAPHPPHFASDRSLVATASVPNPAAALASRFLPARRPQIRVRRLCKSREKTLYLWTRRTSSATFTRERPPSLRRRRRRPPHQPAWHASCAAPRFVRWAPRPHPPARASRWALQYLLPQPTPSELLRRRWRLLLCPLLA